MSGPRLTIIIPTCNRPALLPRAVRSALAQTMKDVEVLVVDDGSEPPASPPLDDPRLRVLRLPRNLGTAAARNAGVGAARTRWITFLDDDDELLPHMAETAMEALAHSSLPQPVALLSGLQVVDPGGRVIAVHRPPSLPRGSHFFLEDVAPECSFYSKQTLVVEREVLLGIGGYDESFRSRVHTEMFLRLNPVCSLQGIPTVGYRLREHPRPRLSRDPDLRQQSFDRLIASHGETFRQHPRGYSRFLREHAQKSHQHGSHRRSLSTLSHAMWLDPVRTAGWIGSRFRRLITRSRGAVEHRPPADHLTPTRESS